MAESRAAIEKNIAELRASIGQLDSETDALLTAMEQKVARSVARIARGDLAHLRRELEQILQVVVSSIGSFGQDGINSSGLAAQNNSYVIRRYGAGEKQVLAEISRALGGAGRDL